MEVIKLAEGGVKFMSVGANACFGDDPYDIYDNNPERALEILKEMLEEKRYDAGCDADKSKTVYWGCSGLFDRLLCNYFHDMADHFKIPVVKDYLNNE